MSKFKLNGSASTDGKGLWSNHKTNVNIKECDIHYLSRHTEKRDRFHAELRVYFSMKDWDTRKHGLIYTDKTWIKHLRNILCENGFSKKAARAVDYSEQGMQGDDYVSLDAGSDFIKEFAIFKTFGEVEEY
jgi:hypothetical protein